MVKGSGMTRARRPFAKLRKQAELAEGLLRQAAEEDAMGAHQLADNTRAFAVLTAERAIGLVRRFTGSAA